MAESSSSRHSDAVLTKLLADGVAALGMSLAPSAQIQLLSYRSELERWNATYNLTAVRDPRQMVTRHLLDSLAVLAWVGGGPILDVGSGAGLPGLVLAIARPELAVSVLDSNGKKARFMRHAVRTLGLANVEVIESRVEAYQPPRAYSQILSRAFASLSDFVAGTRHLLAPGGQWVAMKGKLEGAEQSALPSDCRVVAAHRLQVPGLREERHAVVLTVNQAP